MDVPKMYLIAALQTDRGIGKDGKLPWNIPDDLKRFRALTTGHVVVMGRKTFESIGSKPLKNRVNVVLTNNRALLDEERTDGVIMRESLGACLEIFAQYPDKKVFIIGGSSVYAEAMPFADTFYLTLVHANEPVDAIFPKFDWDFPIELEREKHKTDAGLEYEFITLSRHAAK